MRAELVAARKEPPAQFGKVVNLAVEDHPDRAVLVADRLTARGQVDDRKPPHPHRDVLFEIESFIVGPAMHDGRSHGARSLVISRSSQVSINESENTAHFVALLRLQN